MKLLRLALAVGACSLGIAGFGCAGGSNGTGSAGTNGGAGTNGIAGTSGRAGTTGTAGTSGGAGTNGAAGTTGSAGTTGVAGTNGAAGTSGAAGTNGSAGTSGAAGMTGTAGTTGSAGRGGAGGTTGTAGGGGATAPHGSAAKFICAAGATYGNPLTGIGTVASIAAPSGDFFAFIEGPISIASLGTVFFSDNASNPERIFKLVPPSTTASVFVATSGSNGLAVDNSDNIVAADQRNKRISRYNPMTGQLIGTPISTGSAVANDVLVRSDDNIYFTDPNNGFYRIAPNGTVSAAMKPTQGSRPNGIELSLDENTLYVGDVGNRSITKYTLATDGTVMTATAASFVAQTMHDTVDGMCVDCAGNVYAGTSGGVEVYSSAGTYIGTVPTGESSNCTFGGADRKTLYVTSRAVLKVVTLNVPGMPD